jgi:peptidoglycan/xylan/chitin deacetylase (PgdA/CDA1 family)
MRRQALYRRIFRRGALVILRYHAVGEAANVARYVNPGLAIAPSRFREHVRLLARRFRIVVPDEIPDVLAFARREERPAIAITVDDGYVDNYELATPILADEGVRGAFYVATRGLHAGSWLWTSELWRVLPCLPQGEIVLPVVGTVLVSADETERHKMGRRLTVCLSALPDRLREEVLEELWRRAGRPRGEGLEGSFLTPAQIRAMRAAGMTIGAHTRSHPQLDLLAPQHHDSELRGARDDLEDLLGEPVLHLAYPNPGGNGVIKPPVRDAAARCGYRTAVTSVAGPIGTRTDVLRLPRLGIYAGDQERQFFDRVGRAG